MGGSLTARETNLLGFYGIVTQMGFDASDERVHFVLVVGEYQVTAVSVRQIAGGFQKFGNRSNGRFYSDDRRPFHF